MGIEGIQLLNKTAETNPEPRISVVLATKGIKTLFLEGCLRSLENQTFKQFEIILVYSVYPAAIKSILEKNRVVAVKEQGRTLGAARNQGVKCAKGDIVAFIDDDAEAPENWLGEISSIFAFNPQVACLGGPFTRPPKQFKVSPSAEQNPLEGPRTGTKVALDRFAVGKIAGCNVAYRKEVFEKVGYLNERLRSGEDWEFHIRLIENHYSIRYDPRVTVLHHRQGLKHAFYNSANMVPFYISKTVLRYARYENLFASFYFLSLLPLILLFTLIISPLAFLIVFCLLLLGYFSINAIHSKAIIPSLVFSSTEIMFTIAAVSGFYYGIFRQIGRKIGP